MPNKNDSSKVFMTCEVKKRKEKSVKEKLKDESYRSQVLRSCWLSISSFTLGIVFGQQGSTFLDLQIITNTDVESASFFFTAASCGYMVGSFLSGFVHGKVNNNVLMCVANAGAGVAAIITPYSSPYVLMLIMRFTTHLFCGAIDTLVNAEHMHIWGTDGRTLLQLIHFNFALGGVITPLFTEPFLAAKFITNETLPSTDTVLLLNQTMAISNVTESSYFIETDLSNMTSGQTERPRTTNVHYAFLISGLGAVTTAIPFVFLIFLEKTTKTPRGEKLLQKVHSRKLPRSLYVFVLLVLSFFYVIYCCIEDTFASFLMTFVVNEYETVSKSQGAYITTFYWASFAAGRFGSIFVSKYLTAVRLVSLYSSMMVVSYTGFTISAFSANIDAITVFACMAGISMSAVFPAGISWTEAELFKVTGWVSSCLLIGGSLGMMVNPMIIGYLMKHVSNMWFCYILLGESLLLCAIFIFLLALNRCYINKRYGSIRTATSMEIQVDPPNEEIELKPIADSDMDGSRAQ